MKLKTYFGTVSFLFFFTAPFLFASGSWYGEVALSDNVVPVDCSLTATIINLSYTPSDPDIQQELNEGKATINCSYTWTFSPGGQVESGQGTYSCTGKFATASSTLNDKTVSVNVSVEIIYTADSSVIDSDSYNFSANLTTFTISLSANPTTICAGGDDLEICKSEITATTTPALAGLTITFNIIGNNLEISLNNGSLNSSNAVTNQNGKAIVTLTSSSYSSNPEEDPPVNFKVTVKAEYENWEDTVEIKYNPPDGDLSIFLDPEGEPLDYLIADGESEAGNRLTVKCESTTPATPIPGHTINWQFRFWTIETLEGASQEEYGRSFFDLDDDERKNLFTITPATYPWGTGMSPYGSITSSSITNSSGIASSIYTAGTVAGIIEIGAADTHIYPIWRGSWITDKIMFWRKKRGDQKLNIRVWTDFTDTEIKDYLKNPFLEIFPSSRFEWVSSKFTTFGVNEFNVNNDYGAGWTTGHMASYNGRNIKVYWYKIESTYWDQQKERCGYTAAHEIGHVVSEHHSNCLMVNTPTDLPDNCQSFCDSCRNKFKKLYGE